MFPQLLQRIKKQFSDDKPMVVYRKPGEKTVKAMFQGDNQLHYCTDFKETGFVFAPFDARESVILLIPDEVQEAPYGDSEHKIEKHSTASVSFPTAEPDKKKIHLQLVAKAIKEIEKGTFEKVVLSRQILVPFKGTPLNLFLALLENYPLAFCYMWYHPKVGLWLGATPEGMVSIQNKEIITMSLAGTQPFSGDPDPIWGQKEKEEQNMVTNYIVNALKSLVVQLKISETESVRAGSLMHLRTIIKGRMNKLDIKKLLEALHPTPAVGGVPKNEAYEFIKANENYNRQYYTGYLGELNFKVETPRATNRRNIENRAYRSIHTKTDLFVNLRSMQIEGQHANIFVGGGITKDSDPEREWEETVNKSATMLKVIQNKS